MTVPRLFKHNYKLWRTLHKAVTICLLASLLAGLIPPPLVSSLVPALQPLADLLDGSPLGASVARAEGALSFTKTIIDTPDPVGANDIIKYRLTFSCSSLETGCGDLSITDPLPTAYFDYVTTTTPPGYDVAFDSGSGLLTITRQAVQDGDTADAIVTMRVKPDVPGNLTISNTAEATVTLGPGNQPTTYTAGPVEITTAPPSPQWNVSKQRIIPIEATTPALDTNVTYRVNLCADQLSGNTNLLGTELSDLYPAGAEVVSADGGAIDTGNNTITWSLGDIDVVQLYAGATSGTRCISKKVVLRYPSTTFSLSDQVSNGVAATGTYSMTGATEGPIGDPNNPVSNDHGFAEPTVDVAVSKSANNTVNSAGLPQTWYLAVDTSASNVPINNLVISDVLTSPQISDTIAIFAGGWTTDTGSIKADVQVSGDNGANWTTLGTVNGDDGITWNAPADFAKDITNVRWLFFTEDESNNRIDSVPQGFVTSSNLSIRQTVADTVTPGDTITNCGDLSYDGGVKQDCQTVAVVPYRPEIQVTKTNLGASIANPNDEVSYLLTIGHGPYDSTGDIVNPTLIDLLPSEMEFVSIDSVTVPNGGPQPNYTVIDDFNSTGRQLIRLSWRDIPPTGSLLLDGITPSVSNPFTLPLGAPAIQVQLTVRIKPATVPGNYTNEAGGTDEGGLKECKPVNAAMSDTTDQDGDGNTTEQLCQIPTEITVQPAAVMESQKWVKGLSELPNIDDPGSQPAIADELCPDDSDGFTRFPCVARVYPNGEFTYKLRLRNVGNTPIKDYILYDVLPYVGDTGVSQVLSSFSRATVWQPTLLGPIMPVDSFTQNLPGLLIEYSDANNACRPEVQNGTDEVTPWPAGCVDDWTATPDNYTDVRAFRIKVPFITAQLQPLEGMLFTLPMLAAGDAPVDTVAWNSIAHRSTNADSDLRLEAAEPRKVGVLVPDYADRPIYFDMALRKQLGFGQAMRIIPGGDATFAIEVINQGTVTATNIDIVDYLPVGFSLSSNDANGWTDGGATASVTLPGPLGPGATTTVNIVLTAPSLMTGTFTNTAEIQSVMDLTGTLRTDDIDSTADATNDDNVIDNVLSGDPKLVPDHDEDDHDIQTINVLPPVIGDRIWIESDRDGTADTSTITPVAGHVVTLTTSLGDFYITTTDANGYYSFTMQTAGVYTVTTSTPVGTIPSVYNGTPGNNQSHDPTGAQVIITTGDDFTIDFGFHAPTYSLGNRVWFDTGALTNNGIQDSDESGVSGVLVELLNSAGNPVLVGGQPATATTNASGYYRFDELVAGDYQVRVVVSNFAAGGPLVNYASSLGMSSTFTTTEDMYDTGIDILAPTVNGVTSSIVTLGSGNIPLNETDIATGAGGHGLDGDAYDNLTVDFGFVPLVKIGNRLWIENDNDGNATTGAVIPVPGHVVTLTTSTSQVLTTTTDENGTYYFALAVNSGVYTITTSTPAGTTPSSFAGAPSDNQSHEPTGTPVTVGTSDDLTLDFGFNAPAHDLGNRVWIDMGVASNNGIQESDEAGTVGIAVELLDLNGNPVLYNNSPMVTTTDANGYYRFDNLPAGDYYVRLAASNFAASGPLEKYISSTGASSSFATSDDQHDTGVNATPVTSVVSNRVTLGASDPTSEPDTAGGAGAHGPNGDVMDNLTVDFGFWLPVQIGNRLWIEDDNNGDASDGVIAPVSAGHVVTATTSNGTTVYTGTTDANGYYAIIVPANRTYTITTGLPSGGVMDTPIHAVDGADLIANDRNHRRLGTTVVVTLTDNLSIDFGFFLPQPAIDLIKYTNGVDADTPPGPTIGVGEVVTWTYTISNTGNVTLTNLTLADDMEGSVICPQSELVPHMGMTCVLIGTAVVGPYVNSAVVTGTPTLGPIGGQLGVITDSNPSHYTNTPTVLIGDRLWIEDDNDGDVTTGTVTPVGAGQVVTATASDGTTVYTDMTDANGYYTITVPVNDTYTVTTDLPDGGVVDTSVLVSDGSDPTNNNDLNHDRLGTTVVITTTDNLSIDFGFYQAALIGTIRVVKQSAGGDATFDFSSTDVDLAAIQLATSGGTASSAVITKTAGVYTVTEDTQAGWSLTAITITGEITTNSTVDTGARQAVVNLDAGETVTVTFANSKQSIDLCAAHTVTNTAVLTGSTGTSGVGPITDTATVQINPCLYDYGDLPDADSANGSATTSPNYNTNITGTLGASHLITPGLYLGSLVDDETDGQPTAAANGDDTTGTPDDEDGVTFPTFNPGQPADIAVSVVNTTGTDAVLYGFIDWNGDGSFDDTNEVVTQTVNASGIVTLTFSVPANADTTQQLGARFRLSTVPSGLPNLGPDGPASNGEVEDYLISVAPKVSLGNRVWYDTNNNGMVDPGEQNVANGVLVALYQDSDSSGGFSAGDTLVTRTVTSGGYYTFTALTPSSSDATRYLVVISDTNFLAGGLLYHYHNSTGQITDNSSAAGDNRDHGAPLPAFGGGAGGGVIVASSPISLTATTQPTGEGNEGNDPIQTSDDANSNQTIDFGFYQLVLGNRIWEDLNNNGIDDSEPALSSLLVVTATNQTTSDVYTTTTDANGYYTFTGIVSGTYVVSFQAPAGYSSSSTDGNANGADRDDNGVGSTLAELVDAGGRISSAGFALTPGATIAGVQTATNGTGTTANPSVDFGVWQPAALGNYVWLDTSKDGTQNEAAINGVNGVTVTLFYSNPVSGLWVQQAITQTANHPITTDPGYYTFTNLISGTYYVSFTLPSGYTFTMQDAAGSTEANDSDANEATGATTPITLNAGEQNPNVDAGLLAETLSLGNRVWYDVNNDGLLNHSETGIAGVRVELYRDSDGSGAFTPGVDTFATFSHTINGGYYTFTNLSEGGYVVVISSTNFSGVLLNYRSSDPTTLDPNNNVDSDDNGVRVAGGAVASGVITLTLGNEPDGSPAVDGDNDANTNWTVDFGFYLVDLGDAPNSYSTTLSNSTPYTGASHIISPTLYLGSRVDADDDGQPVVTGTAATNDDDGVTAAAVGGTGDDEDGIVFVNELMAGRVVTVEVTVTGDGGYFNGWLDFDADGAWTQAADQIFDGVAVSNGTTTLTFTVPLTASTGITTYARFRLSTDANLNFYDGNTPALDGEVEDYDVLILPLAAIGDQVWYDNNYNGIQENGETGVMSVTVELLNSSGTVIHTTKTNATGYYSFTNLAPGLYGIRFVTSTLPAGYIITLRDQDSDNAADSDADPTTGRTVNTLLQSGEYDPDWDLGIWQPVPTIEVVKYTGSAGSPPADADLATGPIIAVGETVTWTYEISNTGNVTLTNLALGDDVEGSVSCPATELAPSVGMTCILTGTATEGQYANTAIVTGTPTLGPVTSVTDTNPSHYYGGNPTIMLRKYTNGYDADDLTGPYIKAGDAVTWTYVITNTGNQTLTNLALVDSIEGGITCPVTELAVGATTTCLWTGTAISGQYTNTAVVSGTTPSGSVLTFTNPSHYYGVAPSIVVIKYTNSEDADTIPGPTINAGDPVTWTYVVTNTGNVALTSLNLSDDVEGVITCPATNLAVGASMTCTWTGTASSGQYTNTAIVTGTPNIPTNPQPELPGYPTLPTPNTPVTDTNPSHYFGQAFVLIGDRLWIEDDNDGDVTSGTVTPVGAGHVVTATDGTNVYTDITDVNGYYTITVPANATYTVTTDLPGGGVVDTPVRATDGADLGDNDLNHERLGTTVVVTLTDNLSIDFGFFQPLPTIAVVKYTNGDDADTSPGPTVAMGSIVTWTYVVTNTGNVTLTNVTLVDDREGGITCPQNTLLPGAGMTCILTGTAMAGQYANTAVVTGTPTLGPVTPVTDTNPSHYTGVTAGIGDRVWYDVNYDGVQDSSETGVANVMVELLDGSGNVISTTQTSASGYYSFTNLAPALYSVRFVTSSLPAGYIITLRDAGSDNATDSDADPTTGRTVNTLLTNNEYDPDWDLGIFLPQPTIDVIKYTNGVDADSAPGVTIAVGDPVTWTYAISNTGNVTLTDVTLDDDVEGSVTCPLTELAPHAGMTCVLTGTAIVGPYANTADVTGTPTLGPVTPVTDTNPSHYTNAPTVLIGDRLWIEDDNDGDATSGTVTPVGAGHVVTATSSSGVVYTDTTDANGIYTITVPANATYTVTTDLPGGVVDTPVHATDGADLGDNDRNHERLGTTVVVTLTDNLSIDFGFFQSQPTIEVIKYTNGDDADTPTGPTVAVGSVVTWTYDITNTGNVTLTNVTLVDDREGGITCPLNELAPGTGMTCTLTGTAVAGQYANTAIVTGTPTLGSATPVTDTNPSHYTGLTAGLGDRVWYDTDRNGVQDVGETGVPSVTVQLLNSGGAVLSTTQTSASGYYSFTDLAPGLYGIRFVTSTLPAGYLITLRDAGSDNTADSDADPITGRTVNTLLSNNEYDPDWDLGIWAPQPTIEVIKYTNGDDADAPSGPTVAVGSVVTWTYDITNTGNVTLTNVALADDVEGGVTCPLNELAPGVGMTCVLTGTAVAGQYANTAVVTGTPTLGPVTPVTDTNPSHYTGLTAGLGDRVWYDTDRNGIQDVGENGVPNVTVQLLTSGGAVLSTTQTSVSGYYSFTDLAPGVYSIRFVTSTLPSGYLITLRDAGTDAADSDGDPITGRTVNTLLGANEYDPTWDLGIWSPQPTIEVVKYTNGADADLATGPIIAVGDTVTWSYAITNTGNVTLTNVTLTDDVEGGITCPLNELAPGVGMTCVLTGTAVAGQYANTAVVTGTPTLGPVSPVTDTNPSHYYGGNPGIVLRKYTNGYDADGVTGPYVAAGGVVTWTYIVTNTGNQTLTNLALTDSVEGAITCPVSSLVAGESTTCTWTGTAISGQYTNTAIVSGTTPGGSVLTFTNPSHYYGVAPSIALRKYTNGEDADTIPGPTINAGATVTWTYVMTNTGNVALTNITLSDDIEGGITCPAIDLAIGGSMTCIWTGVAVSGQYTNTAVVTGTPNIPTNSTPDLPGVPTIPTPNTPVTDTNPSHYVGHTVSLGDYVWVDEDGDGRQDGTEPSVEGVTVTLTTPTGAVITTTTDANGVYTFTNLLPNETYTVTFSTPDGYSFTTSNQGGDSSDSDAPASGVVVVTLGTTDDLTIDAGLVQGVNVGNYVWFDTDKDGKQDANEPGIAGAVVALFEADGTTPATDLSGTTVPTQTTGSDGLYNFGNLPAAGYIVQVTMPAGYSATPVQVTDANTDDNTDSNIASSNSSIHSSGVVTLTISGEPATGIDTDGTNGNLTVDFGFIGVNIGDYVWVDGNGNGIQDEPSTSGLEGVTVTLTTPAGVVFTTYTDASGYYTFTNLLPNTVYTVTFSTPHGYNFTNPNQGGDDTDDSDAPANGVVVITTGTMDDLSIDAGLVSGVNVGNYVWFDTDKDGSQDANELGIAGAVVALFLADGSTPATDLSGATVVSQTTGSDGLYNFTNLPEGGYVVKVTMPAGYNPTINQEADANTDDDTDSNITSSSGSIHSSDVVTLTIGGEPASGVDTDGTNGNLSVDFGFIGVTIGDYVWVDGNGNGVQDEPGTSGMEGVTVTLTLPDGNQLVDYTDASGYYTFTNLLPNTTYTVTFATPDGYSITNPNQGGDDSADSDAPANGVVVVTTGITDDITIDAGLVQGVNVGNYVWFDTDKDGTQDNNEPGIAGAVVSLFQADATTPAVDLAGNSVPTQTTGSDGLYTFSNLPAGGYMVQVTMPTGYTPTINQVADPENNDNTDSNIASNIGQVYRSGVVTLTISSEPTSGIDTDGTNGNLTVDFGFIGVNLGNYVWVDVNGNGRQDEPVVNGLGSVTVTLTTATGAVMTTTTDATGYYTFTNLMPNATYTVTFLPPTGYEFTTPNIGGDGQDSDAPNGGVVVVTLGVTDDWTVDAGLIQAVGVGNYVWFDSNVNGLQDATEPGIAGAVVELLDLALNAVVDLNGNMVLSQATGSDGHYVFGNLRPGSYIVQVTMPTGYSATINQVVNPNTDADNDSNIATSNGQVHQSDVVTLGAGAEPTNEKDESVTLLDANSNLSVDFGFIGVNLGDYVWVDEDGDGQQAGTEPGVEGVTVTLTTPTGAVITTTTDANGVYTFTNLIPNTSYTVTFSTPDGYSFTTPNQGSDSSDSDAPANGVVVVTMGITDNLTIDAGLVQGVNVGNYVWFDTDKDGKQDTGEPGIAGAVVELFEADGTTPAVDLSGNAVAAQTTDSDGLYNFGNLPVGSYVVQVTMPAGYSATPLQVIDVNNDDDTDSNIASNAGNIYNSGVVTLTISGEPSSGIDTDGTNGNLTVDFGFVGVTLGDYVWVDGNGNGVQDEPATSGKVGVTLTLTLPDGSALTTVTDASGYYSFTNLVPNTTYTVSFSLPGGYSFTNPNQGGDDTADSDAPASGVVVINLGSQNDLTIDAGLVSGVNVGNYVWFDTDKDGLQDANEPGIAGAIVELFQADGTTPAIDLSGVAVVAQTTGSDGLYIFGNLPEGGYVVKVTMPAGYSATPVQVTDANSDDNTDSNIAGNVGQVYSSGVVTLTINGEPAAGVDTDGTNGNLTVDFGFIGVNLGDYVWLDSDRDGQQDATEKGISAVAVILTWPNGITATTTTDNNGGYLFTNLLPNQIYTITFVAPAGYLFTLPNVGADPQDSDAPANGVVVVTLGTSDDLTIDAGLYQPAGIGDRVWYDDNRNHVQDGNDVGVAGVAVVLLDGSGAVISTTTTNATGYYSFTNLTPGDYALRFVTSTLPSGYVLVMANGGAATVDSDANQTSGATTLTTLTSSEYDPTWDAGIYQRLASLGDTVWEDLDHDGIQDPSEPGIPAVMVTLTGANGMTETVATDANGHYTLTNLLPGAPYTVTFTTPARYEPTLTDVGDDTTDSDGRQVIVTLQPGEHNPTIDSGFWRPLSLGNQVWEDLNNSGVKDGTEAGVAGVTVNLYRDNNNDGEPDGAAMATMTTDGNGLYLFAGLTSDTYLVEIVAPVGYVSSTPDAGDADVDGDDSDDNGIGTGAGVIRSHSVTLVVGAEPVGEDPDNDLATPDSNENLTVDFGIWRPVNLGNYVWLDNDRDGQQDGSESGVANVVVTLQLPTAVVITTTTDATGHYTFTNLLPNQLYVVTFTPPAGFSLTLLNQGDDALDSDPDNSGEVTVTLGTIDDYTIDAGLVVNPVRVGDVAFIDMNLNGRQDAGDQPLPGTLLHLTKADGGGPLGAATDVFGNPVLDQTTDGSGHYLFANLLPGEYSVHVVSVPTGYAPTTPNVGSPDLDSSTASASSSPTTGTAAVPGGEDLTLDFGFVPLVSLGNLVWHDGNNNGQVDAGEPGIPNVTLHLFHEGDNPLTATPVATDVTDGNGNYLFENLLPGSYFVYIPTPPPAYPLSSTPTDSADNGEDNDDNGIQPTPGQPVRSPIIDLTPGDEPDGNADLTLDFSFIELQTLGNLVWQDKNNNGQVDAGETGVPNVTVQLFREGDDPTTATPLQTDVTDADGHYLFENVEPGRYFVYIPTPPTLFPVSSYATDPADNGEDNDDNGDQPTLGAVRSPVVTLTPGGEPTNDGDGASGDLTVDFGFFALASLGDRVWEDLNHNGVQDVGEPGIANVTVTLTGPTGARLTTTTDANGLYSFTQLLPGIPYTVTFSTPVAYTPTTANVGDDSADSDGLRVLVASLLPGEHNPTIDSGFCGCPLGAVGIGDYVWYDTNHNGIQEAGESGIAGVTVELLNAQGAVIGTTTTNVTGYYSFTNLTPAIYSIHFVASSLPTGYVISPVDQGGNAATDSDANPSTLQTPPTELTPGEFDPTWDLGLYLEPTGVASIGDFVWFDGNINGIQDAGETGVSGITVTLYAADGTKVNVVRTNADGYYNFSNLVPGLYYLEFTAPAGYVSTIADVGNNDTQDNDVDPATGRTPITVLTTGEDDLTWDYGVYLVDLVDRSLIIAPANIGNQVWFDKNQDGLLNNGESGAPSVTVSLYDSHNQLIATDVTDANGNYGFLNLPPGEYYLVITLPTGFLFVPTVGTDPAVDNDSNANPATGITVVTILTVGETDNAWDTGIYQKPTDIDPADEPAANMPYRIFLPRVER